MIPLLLALVVGGGAPSLSSCAVYEVGVGQDREVVRIWTAETKAVSPKALPEELRGWWDDYSRRVVSGSFSGDPVAETNLARELLDNVPPSALIMVHRWLFERQDGSRGGLTTVALPSGAAVTRIRDLETGGTLVMGGRVGHGDVGRLIEAFLEAPDEGARSEVAARIRQEASEGEFVCQVGSERRDLSASQGAEVGATLLELGRRLPEAQWHALRRWLAFLTRLRDSDCLEPKGELSRLSLAFDPRRLEIEEDVAEISACTVELSTPLTLHDHCDGILRERFGRGSLRPLELHADFADMFRELAP